MIAKKQFEPAGFQLELGLKDCNLVLDEANSTKTPMPLANLVHNRLLASVAKDRGKQDWAALTKLANEEAGLE
jgi:3-hydroxyisobutyrate dehydrogenase-like beta-hydroxyacid dehydrogenase